MGSDFVIFILCIVVICFVCWVLNLKSTIQKLTEENKKLRNALKLGVHEITGDIEIGKSETIRWGKKVNLPDAHFHR